MNNLGEGSALARKVIKYGGIGIVALMVGRLVIGGAISYYKKLNPPPPPPPDVKFGKLPKLIFPEKPTVPLAYRLETRTGTLPTNLPNQFTVFFMPIKKPNLLAYDMAKAVANRLNFIQEPKKLTERNYRWDASSPVPSSFTIDIITGAFVMNRKWQDDPSYLTPTIFYNESQAVDRIYNLLSRVELLPEDIKTGTYTVQNLKAENGQIVSAVSLSQSQFVQVNLYRKSVDETPVVSPRAERGLISGILALQREDDRQFVQLDYNYFPVDMQTSAVYPLITVGEAWKRMQSNGGYIVAVKPETKEVTVREITLAYYDAEQPQQFMQPVYVFRGDSDFVGYVPALADEWVE